MWPFFDTERRNFTGPIWPAPKVGYNTLLDVKFVEGSSAPTEPVNVQEFKDWAKVDVADDDTIIGELITAGREICERFLNVSMIPRTVIAIIDNCNGNSYLPYCPFNELISIQDVNGDAIETDRYRLELEDFKRLAWPCFKYIRLEYTAGYNTLPGKLRTGLLQQVLWMYQHRGDEEHLSRGGDISNMSPEAEATLSPFRRVV